MMRHAGDRRGTQRTGGACTATHMYRHKCSTSASSGPCTCRFCSIDSHAITPSSILNHRKVVRVSILTSGAVLTVRAVCAAAELLLAPFERTASSVQTPFVLSHNFFTACRPHLFLVLPVEACLLLVLCAFAVALLNLFTEHVETHRVLLMR